MKRSNFILLCKILESLQSKLHGQYISPCRVYQAYCARMWLRLTGSQERCKGCSLPAQRPLYSKNKGLHHNNGPTIASCFDTCLCGICMRGHCRQRKQPCKPDHKRLATRLGIASWRLKDNSKWGDEAKPWVQSWCV